MELFRGIDFHVRTFGEGCNCNINVGSMVSTAQETYYLTSLCSRYSSERHLVYVVLHSYFEENR